jgi:hypothetical protein
MTYIAVIDALMGQEKTTCASQHHIFKRGSKHRDDDQVDSLSQFLGWARNRSTGEPVFRIS